MSSFSESVRCDVCGEPLKGRGVAGTCQSCLLVQSISALWNPREPPSAEEVSKLLPRFEIHDELGRGALGIVYRATDTKLNRTVAVKAMTANPDNPEFAQRFEREASAMAKLNHPHIVTVHDYGTAETLHFLVMEWMEGGTLEEEMGEKGKLPVPRAIEVIGQICDALQYAHSQGVIHRDVKPSNILLDRDGTAKLSDFGLVKGLLQEEFAEVALTRTDMAIGTPRYMAPEQMEGSANVDHRADIYSAGAVLYQLMTGEVPTGRHKAASKFPGVPNFVDPVIDRAMHKDPSSRYESASAIKEDMAQLEGAKRRLLVRLGTIVGFVVVVLAVAKGFVTPPGGGKASERPDWIVPKEAKEGLLLGGFESEVDLNKWRKLADYDFEDGLIDQAYKQEAITLVEGAGIENGRLKLAGMGQSAEVLLKRDNPRPLLGLAIHFRFLPEEYLAVGKHSMGIAELTLNWAQGIFLYSSKWGDTRPSIMLGMFQPLAPPGVIEPSLEPGEWHDVWLVLTDGWRVWIDGEPVYRSSEPQLDQWINWKGEEAAYLRFDGFRGLVEHVQVWEQL